MDQSKLTSLMEALLNTVIGFFVSFLAWPIAGALVGIEYSTGQHWAITAFFTVISVARGYLIRRFFSNGLHIVASKIAKKLIRI